MPVTSMTADCIHFRAPFIVAVFDGFVCARFLLGGNRARETQETDG